MTKKIYSAFLAGTAVLAVGLGATGANAATANGDATANIVQALTIQQDATLNFGTIVPAAGASTVSIDTGGVKTCGAGLTCSGASVAGAFTATGTASQAVTISLGAGTATLTSVALDTMAVSALTPSAASGTLSGLGTISFTVGGTLAVGASQAAGVYSGTYPVTVNYN